MKWIFIIAIGFICLACPFLILLYLQWMPGFISVAFAIWLICCIGTIAFSKGKDKKWYIRMIPSFILTLVFTILFLTAMDTEHYMFDENHGLWVFAPTLSLPSFYLIGAWINEKWLAKQEKNREKYNISVDRQIREKQAAIQTLETSITERIAITKIIKMLDCFGEDTTQISCDPRINNIASITSEIKQMENEIASLQKSRK